MVNNCVTTNLVAIDKLGVYVWWGQSSPSLIDFAGPPYNSTMVVR